MESNNTSLGGRAQSGPVKPTRKRRSFIARWSRRLVGGLGVFALVTWLFGAFVLSRVIDWQLKSQLASRVNAKLETASVRYLFPYGVRIEKAHLIVPDTAEGRGWGIDVGRLELTLAKLPLGAGPLVIQSLDIDEPVIRLSAADTTAASAPLPASPQPAATSTATASKKLSDLFQLRRVTVNDARVEFDPGTRQRPKPPVVWEHLNANMLTTPTKGGNYAFSFLAKDEPLAVIHADGAFDIDSLLLDMQKLTVVVQVDPKQQAMQLPPIAQAVCQKFKIGGQVTFEATARVPLDDPMHGLYTARMALANGTGDVPALGGPVSPAQFSMICSNLTDTAAQSTPAAMPGDLPKRAPPLHLWVAGLKVCSDKRLLEVTQGEIRFDPLTGIWSLRDLKGLVDSGNGPRPIVSLNANGLLDLNSMVLDLQKLSLAVKCELAPSSKPTALAGDTQPKLNVGGQVTVDAVAKVPLRTPVRSLFTTRMSLQNGVGQVPGLDGPVSPAECLMVCSNLPGTDDESLPATITSKLPNSMVPVRLWVRKLKVGSAHRLVQIDRGELGFNSVSGAWSVRDVKGVVDTGQGPKPIAMLNGNGAIDLGAQMLDVQKLSLVVNATQTLPELNGKGNMGVAPAKLNIGGQLTLNAIAKVPLKTPLRGLFIARMTLENCTGEVPGVAGSISPAECLMVCSNLPGPIESSLPIAITDALPKSPAPVRLWLDNLKMVNGGQLFQLVDGEASFDPVALTWKIDHLRGLLDAGDGPGVARDANIKVHVPFSLAGSGQLIDQNSQLAVAETSHLDLTLTGAAADVAEQHIPIRHINGVVMFHPHEIVSRKLTATSMGGNIAASLDTSWRKLGTARKLIPTYFGDIQIVDMDIHKVAIVLTPDESVRARATGFLDFAIRFHGLVVPGAPATGTDSVANQFAGAGDFDVKKGYFATIPVLKDVLGQFQNMDAATIGEAAGTFTIAKRVVTFQQAAASAPAVGVQGTGTVTFDQMVNMVFVATPMADWRQDIKSSGNSFFDGLADVAGKVQGAINRAEAKSLYQVQVTGPLTDTKSTLVLLPSVSGQVDGLFQKMSGAMEDNGVLQELKRRAGQ